jgi:hypothetical protein
MLKVFNIHDADLSHNGLAILQNAGDIVLEQELNGIDILTFNLPLFDSNLKYIDASKYLIKYNNQLYFPVSSSSDEVLMKQSIVCRHYINFLSLVRYIYYLPVVVNKDPQEIMVEALNIFYEGQDDEFKSKYRFELFTPQELNILGMEWVDERIDIVDGLENTNLMEIIITLIQGARVGELYYDNHKIAIVKRIGKDTNTLLDSYRNVDKMISNIDYSQIINKIYIEGEEGMPLDTDIYPNSQILSQESIDLYGVREGRLEFPEVDNKEELENKALWNINPANQNRVDIPKFTINLNAELLDYQYNIGDVLRIKSNILGIDVLKRVVKKTENVDKNMVNYTIGDKPLSFEDMLTMLNMTRERFNKITNNSDLVKIEGLEQLAPFLQSGKNFCHNSSFEWVDENDAAYAWKSNQVNITTKSSNRFGSRSAMLYPGNDLYTDPVFAPDIEWYEAESDKTMVSFFHKNGLIRIWITDMNDNIVPHVSINDLGTYVLYSEFEGYSYYGNQKFIIFRHEDCGTSKYKVHFKNVGDFHNCYLDGVLMQPSLKNRMQLYLDGPNSEEVGLPTVQVIKTSVEDIKKYYKYTGPTSLNVSGSTNPLDPSFRDVLNVNVNFKASSIFEFNVFFQPPRTVTTPGLRLTFEIIRVSNNVIVFSSDIEIPKSGYTESTFPSATFPVNINSFLDNIGGVGFLGDVGLIFRIRNRHSTQSSSFNNLKIILSGKDVVIT